MAAQDSPLLYSQPLSPSFMSSPVKNKGLGSVIPKSAISISKLKIFIGYDPREDLAYQVCKHSLLKHASLPLEILPIKQLELRNAGLYTRSRDPTESTEFSFTRFLTPFLAGYEGWAMFVDCDFLYTADIRELVEMIDDRYAVMCVQHDYTPTAKTKMDGVVQTVYPRKNWSSMVLYNCSHPKNKTLTPDVVNSQTGAFLHRFMWLDDTDIGAIPYTWNFLVGHNELPRENGSSGRLPKAIHYTCGGPWFEAWRNCEYADVWIQEMEEYKRARMVQKVIWDQVLNELNSHKEQRAAELEDRVIDLESSFNELKALQRVMLHNLQSKGLLTPESNGKEVSVKLDGHLSNEERAFQAT